MKKRKATSDFMLEVTLERDGFIAPPTDPQRHWLLNRFLREASSELKALDRLAQDFVRGSPRGPVDDMKTAELADDEIMEEWQRPLMEAMAEIAGREGASVLEVGFGLGVSADMLQARRVGPHTIVECNASVVRRFYEWRTRYPDREIRLVEGLWEDVMDELGMFDSIFFHTYALDEEEAAERLSSVAFADNFFAVAARHLEPGGRLTYLTGEIDSLGRSHQRLLLEHFGSVRIAVVPLELPDDVKDAWWADSMVVVEAVK